MHSPVHIASRRISMVASKIKLLRRKDLVVVFLVVVGNGLLLHAEEVPGPSLLVPGVDLSKIYRT